MCHVMPQHTSPGPHVWAFYPTNNKSHWSLQSKQVKLLANVPASSYCQYCLTVEHCTAVLVKVGRAVKHVTKSRADRLTLCGEKIIQVAESRWESSYKWTYGPSSWPGVFCSQVPGAECRLLHQSSWQRYWAFTPPFQIKAYSHIPSFIFFTKY